MAAKAGDAGALAVLGELGWWLALGLSNLALALDPAVMVYGGGLVETVDAGARRVRARLRRPARGPRLPSRGDDRARRARRAGRGHRRRAGGPGGRTATAAPRGLTRRRVEEARAGGRHAADVPRRRRRPSTRARRAEELGLDGVFVFDHLWPMGAPERPALSAFPVLGAVAAVTRPCASARSWRGVGLVPDDVLVAELVSLDRMAPGRLDRRARAPATARARRRTSPSASPSRRPTSAGVALRRLRAARLLASGVPVWVGGGTAATTELAVELGAAVNLWEGQPAAVAASSRVRGHLGRSGGRATRPASRSGCGAGRRRRHLGGVRMARVARGRGRGGRHRSAAE